MSTIKIHDTQPQKERLYDSDNVIDECLRSIQNIVG